MKLIDNLQEQIQSEIDNAIVKEEAFDLWQSNEITKLFLAEMKVVYIDLIKLQPVGSSEQVFAQQIQRKAACDILEQFLEWNPISGSK